MIGEVQAMFGGVNGNSEIAVTVSDPSKIYEVGALLARILDQEVVTVVSDSATSGLAQTKVVVIRMPDGYTAEETGRFYKQYIAPMTDNLGVPLVDAVMAGDGSVRLVVPAENIDAVKAGIDGLTDQLNIDIECYVKDTYAGNIRPYSEDVYGKGELDLVGGSRKKVRAKTENVLHIQQEEAELDEVFRREIRAAEGRAEQEDSAGSEVEESYEQRSPSELSKLQEWRKQYADPNEEKHRREAEQLRGEEPRSYQAEFERAGLSPRESKSAAQRRAVIFGRINSEIYRRRIGLSGGYGLSVISVWELSIK